MTAPSGARAPRARFLIGLAAFMPPLAIACGACIEDKVAATYDHATVSKAIASKQVVVFGEIEGAQNAARLGERIVVVANGVDGVQHGTTHTSASPAAFSFVLDPKAQRPEAAIATLEHRIGIPGVRLTFIRVMP